MAWRAPPPGFFERPAEIVAPELLGAQFITRVDQTLVGLRLTEVEAYGGIGEDPGSHAFRRRTPRNESMFLPGGHLYVYLSYGVHWCVNVVTGYEDEASAVLLRAGEVVEGAQTAAERRNQRGRVVHAQQLASGPGRLGAAMGLDRRADAVRIEPGGLGEIRLPVPTGRFEVAVSTRTGVAGEGGAALSRYYLVDDPTVSRHRPAQS